MFFRELETDRILLKNISYEDKSFIFEQFSNDTVNRYLFDAEPLNDIQEAEEIISFYTQPEPRAQHRWILVNKDNGTKLGTCGFHCWDPAEGCCDVGYDLKPEFWGKGYMQEAMKAILAFAQKDMKVRQIKACIYEENDNSIKLAERMGFIFTGITENVSFRDKNYLHKILILDTDGQ